MGYYREYYLKDFRRQSAGSFDVSLNPLSHTQYGVVLDYAELLTYRSRGPSSRADISYEVPDHVADPYASFLRTTSEDRYTARLSERGMKSRGRPDNGHTFDLQKYRALTAPVDHGGVLGPELPSGIVTRYAGSNFRSADGISGIYPTGTDAAGKLSGGRYARLGSNDLDAWAQQAYVNVSKTVDSFDAAAFLGELREGLPKLVPELLKDPLKFFKSAGSDYLNVEFGWKPFINDIVKIGQSLKEATALLAANGERVHRRFAPPAILNSTPLTRDFSLGGIGGIVPPDFPKELLTKMGVADSVGVTLAPPIGEAWGSVSTSQERWFEGEFSQFFPLDFDPQSYLSRLDQLVSYKLTPSSLWQLAPWSWLVDWMFDIQSTIDSNINAANDLLVMHYGYAMEHSIRTDFITYNVSLRNQPGGSFLNPAYRDVWRGPRAQSWITVSERKRRIRANPYGFKAKSPDMLNARQAAILGALALTKG